MSNNKIILIIIFSFKTIFSLVKTNLYELSLVNSLNNNYNYKFSNKNDITENKDNNIEEEYYYEDFEEYINKMKENENEEEYSDKQFINYLDSRNFLIINQSNEIKKLKKEIEGLKKQEKINFFSYDKKNDFSLFRRKILNINFINITNHNNNGYVNMKKEINNKSNKRNFNIFNFNINNNRKKRYFLYPGLIIGSGLMIYSHIEKNKEIIELQKQNIDSLNISDDNNLKKSDDFIELRLSINGKNYIYSKTLPYITIADDNTIKINN